MRSPQQPSGTRDRILAAAIERFGRDGFDASLRAIAADAGVSAPAIVKHFGSKEALHSACDQEVLRTISHSKMEAMGSSDLGGMFLTQIAVLDEFQPLVRYLMRSVLAGGQAARNTVDQLRTEALEWMDQGVQKGHIKPTRNEELRVKLAFSISIGWMVQSVLMSDRDIAELDSAFWHQTLEEMLLPTLELYTEGLLTDRAMLEEYLLYISDPPSADASADG